MAISDIDVKHEVGLHARPASIFVRTAARFPCDIQVSNVSKNTTPVNAKSILSVLTLGVNQGDRIRLETKGEQENEALQTLVALIEGNFGEG